MPSPITVGIVDDHPGVRIGLRNLLSIAEGIVVVGEAADGEAAIRLAEQTRPNVLLLDVELPLLRGDIVAKRLQHAMPEVEILAVSSFNDPAYVQAMMDNGAAGYITKDEVPSMLIPAVRSLVQDHVKWLSPNAVRKVANITLDGIILTGVEVNFLRNIILGKTDDELIQVMSIDRDKLEEYLGQLFVKFGTENREELKKAACSLLCISPS